MRFERLELTCEPALLVEQVRALVAPPESVQAAVAEIIEAVHAGGDRAVRDYTRRFDTDGADPAPLRVDDDDLDTALETLDPAIRKALELAIENVDAVARAWSDRGEVDEVAFGDHVVRLRSEPVMRAGVYVPGGRAPYPSTVVMGVVPARVAGVDQIYVCAPPGSDGEVDRVVLAASRLAGASGVYRMGGAQAIAALAHGTESVSAVDVIVGPGNLYVQEAKRQVFGRVGIDGFAGPSDLVVIADGDADPELLALDLLAQAEHGPGTLVIAISRSPELLEELGHRIIDVVASDAVAVLVLVKDAAEALAVAEAFAPEHLQLVGAEAERLAGRVRRAGCVFVGAASGTAFGDYIAGSNHILPTNGAARFGSGLSPAHFLRRFSEVQIARADELARTAAPLARAEGFELHARSMEARIRDNG